MNIIQMWLPQIKTKSSYLVKIFWINRGRKFNFAKHQIFYKKVGIIMNYVTPNIYKENGLVKQRWKTIIIIENTMLINNSLSNRF